MKTKILVALAPAIACALLGFIVEVRPKLPAIADALMRKRNVMETLKEVLSHSAFLGSGFAAFMGFNHDDPGYYWVAGLWFSSLMFLVFGIAYRLDQAEEAEKEAMLSGTTAEAVEAMTSENDRNA